ncbi:MAG: tripartite tricarboxylate transporter substrate binding protein [Proteobacteria bacterium]|nr:tripartite tricarboxylate transporter substrate binding protein [Pseudomonadota bacterium]
MRIKALLVAVLLVVSGAAQAQAWPTRPVKIIVPYPPGGVTDMFSRVLAAQLQESFGQPFLVENKPGASQMVGAVYVAKAPPDGYTLYVGSTTSLGMNAYTQKNIQYDPVKDFAPVSLAMTMPMFLVVNPSVPATNVRELVAVLKANPGKYSYATTGNGSSTHMAGELFKKMTGTEMTAIPYKGSGPGIADLIAGQVQLSIDPGASSLPSVKSGKLRALAVTGKKRFSLMPDLPTIDEAGVPGYESVIWFGIVATAGTPPAVTAKLSHEIGRILRLPANVEKFGAFAIDLTPTTPEEFGALIKADVAKWAKELGEAGIKPE